MQCKITRLTDKESRIMSILASYERDNNQRKPLRNSDAHWDCCEYVQKLIDEVRYELMETAS